MYNCPKCKNELVVYLNPNFDFYSHVVSQNNKLIIKELFIKRVEVQPIFYCINCNEPISDVRIKCRSCDKFYPIEELKSHIGMPLCIHCIKKFEYDATLDFTLPTF